ncbi:hypothetical protein CIB84_004837 [Bambusicola thoracicus]|uniref:Uncharacterized protein n=1 Tax=Bambusicola thoracicus TaxID=9083 RepID=A0A2P4T500_BAMTH|nr:hypothetical protein CIB84_004837 [Bambusicola thoracicus]
MLSVFCSLCLCPSMFSQPCLLWRNVSFFPSFLFSLFFSSSSLPTLLVFALWELQQQW